MSHENVETTRLGYELFNRRDVDAFLDLCSEDVEWHDLGAFDTSAIVGREALRAHLKAVLEPWEELRRDPEEIIDLGDNRVLGLCRAIARGKGSGIEVEAEGGDLLTFRDGKVVQFRGYPRADALEAAGLDRAG